MMYLIHKWHFKLSNILSVNSDGTLSGSTIFNGVPNGLDMSQKSFFGTNNSRLRKRLNINSMLIPPLRLEQLLKTLVR